MDERMRAFLNDFATLSRLAQETPEPAGGEETVRVLTAHLGVAPSTLPVVTESLAQHRLADAGQLLDRFMGADPESRLLGLSGQQRHHMEFSDLLEGSGMPPGRIGEPDYETVSIGPDAETRVVSCGLYLFDYPGSPLVVLLRQAHPQYGRTTATLEVLGVAADVVDGFMKEFRAGLREHSIFRGHVISFTASDYSNSAAGITFHRRLPVGADEVILPAGTLERIESQVLEVGRHGAQLLKHGAHLKRGVLLYGPPGTGKTHTVRYLASQAADSTIILLSGNTLALVSEAARMARALQPSIVVLEDCDLVAEDRGFSNGPQPLLFEVLDAMDGLDADADVVFLLTTNRVELLEEALVQRPGRVDLAVEIPRPDAAARRALLELYGSRLALRPETLDRVAAETDGTTASFMKELTRRATLLAVVAGQEPGDAHLVEAAVELMSDAATLTRNLLGGTADPAPTGDGTISFGGLVGEDPSLGFE